MEWLIFVIVLGLISSVFNNQNKRTRRGNDTNRPKRYESPDTVSESKPKKGWDWDSPFDVFEEAFEEFEIPKRETKPSYTFKSERKSNTVKETPKSPKKETTKAVKAVSYTKDDNKLKMLDSSKENLSANQALQGMMWAEIFGPPRSKKPHISRGRRSY